MNTNSPSDMSPQTKSSAMLSEITAPSGPQYFQHHGFSDCPVQHGFFTRCGGVSTGLYDSLNCGPGSDDHPHLVHENRHHIARVFGRLGSDMPGLYQVHSATCLTITQPPPYAADHRPQADALVTDQPNIVLSILTADCLPLLFAEPDARIIGAAHAGWRGAEAGIIESTLEAMCNLGARRQKIRVVIGPAIQQPSYQIDSALADRLSQHHPDASLCCAPDLKHSDKRLFDLPLFALQILEQAGIEHKWSSGLDSYTDSPRFFSHRRATHRNEPDSGRLISTICLTP